jgi:hypothetical protein
MEQSEFKKWLTLKYPALKEVTITTTVSDAFFIFNHDLGISFDDIIDGRRTLDEYKESVRIYLINNGKNPGTRPSGYTSHIKYLIEYAQELGLTKYDVKLEIKKPPKNINRIKPQNKVHKLHAISKNDVDDAYDKVKQDPIYGEENRAIKAILNKFPNNNSLEEVVCKICVIDVTHSTHVGIHKKNFSLVDLAKKIMFIPNIDRRLETGDLTLINDIAYVKGVNLLSFASKYCTCHNQMIYDRDDYFKYDSIVSKAIHYRGRDFIEYSKKLDEIITSNRLSNIERIREKLDLYYWYNNK